MSFQLRVIRAKAKSRGQPFTLITRVPQCDIVILIKRPANGRLSVEPYFSRYIRKYYMHVYANSRACK